MLHEFPHEISDFIILEKSGYGICKIVFLQLLTALGALGGCIAGLKGKEMLLGDFALPFTAGGFIYLAVCVLLGELKASQKNICDLIIEPFMIFVGLLFMHLFALLE